jgi:hypothetical protein
MKYLFIALTISMAVAYANGLSCWTCPFTASGEDKCLFGADDLGQKGDCSGFQDSCETLAIDDESAPLRYNRRCARLGANALGCTEVQISTPDGETYPGRICFCQEDDCNTVS